VFQHAVPHHFIEALISKWEPLLNIPDDVGVRVRIHVDPDSILLFPQATTQIKKAHFTP
jgi:hypothetical protein